jgi:hypothetical protein
MTPKTILGNADLSLEELTSTGIGSGLETEPSEDVNITSPFDPEEIDVITQNKTVDLLMSRLKEGELKLSPDFQRRSNLWNESMKTSLIESMLLRIPIPSLYVAEDEKGDYTVVDGLQRFCAISHFVCVEALNKAVDGKLNPLRLTQLESLRKFEGHSFAELPRPLQRRVNETELTLHVIRAGTPPDVKFNIFSRINRGGLPLTSQEIRNAIYKGAWRTRIRKFAASSAFKEATEDKIKAERMEDLELVLRFVALYSQSRNDTRPPDQNLDKFLNDFVEHRCSSWTDEDWDKIEKAFFKAMIWTPKIFGKMAFRKYNAPNEHRKPINRGLFETESVAIARRNHSELELLSNRSQQVTNKFGERFKNDKLFIEALLYATGRGLASNKRLEVIDGILDEVLK